MDAVKFIEEARRRYKVTGKSPSVLLNWLEPEYIVKEVEEWAATHTTKTRQSEFLKEWPDTYLDGNRVISIAPCIVNKEYQNKNCDQLNCDECRKGFWMQEVK